MPRIQPALTKAESDLIEKVAEITQTKRTDVIRNALAVYHWFVRNAVLGARVVALKPSGEEVTLETPEMASLQAKGLHLSPEELGLLAKQLAATTDAQAAARLKERLTRGFFGI